MEVGLGQMGLSSDAFWSMSYVEFALAYKGYSARERAADRRAGEIAATICNASPYWKNPPAGGFQAEDFFPSLQKPEPQQHDVSEDKMLADIALLKALSAREAQGS